MTLAQENQVAAIESTRLIEETARKRQKIKQLMDLIRRINGDLGITIIIIEHFMRVLTELTETLLVIESGRLICCDDPETVACDPKVIECYLGETYAEDK